jgi:drug/metabolite transporter (DMT)-like permease
MTNPYAAYLETNVLSANPLELVCMMYAGAIEAVRDARRFLAEAEVALPVTVAMPILLVLLIGRVFYRERLTPAAWAACLIGALAVAALAVGRGS